MTRIIKKIVSNKKHRNIAVFGVLCALVAGFSMWFFISDRAPVADIDEPEVPLGSFATTISAGDIVVVNVSADELDAMYGYQFDVDYNREYLEYRKRLYSDIDEILTIFATDKEQNLLVGATMIGDAKGYSGQGVPVCRVEFIALSDFDMEPDFDAKYITLSRVNVVSDDLSYLENVDGWTASITVLSLL